MNDTTTSIVASDATPDEKQRISDLLGEPATKPWWRRGIFIAGAVGLLIAVLLLSRWFGAAEASGYATDTVERGNLTVTVSATGNLQPTNQVEVGSEQSGIVTDVYVDNNDRVVRGQPLARLDTARLRDTIAQNQAALAAAQAQVATAEATAAQARANLSRQEEVYRISGGRVPSATELDAARAEYRRAQAGIRAAQAQVAQARAVLSSAQTNLSKATIYSPVTGVVLSRAIDPGQTVAASFQAPVLFTIAEDLGQMQLEVRVDEADVGQVREGQRATFTVDAFPGQRFTARIIRVDVGANASGTSSSTTGSSGNVVSYTAILALDNPGGILRPGMTATAEILATERRNALLVPNAALRFSPAAGGQSGESGVTKVLMARRPRGNRQARQPTIGRGSEQTVYVLGPDGQPRPVRVTVGESNGSVTEITGGDLRPGVQVITGQLASRD